MHVIRLRGPWEFAAVQPEEWQSGDWRRFQWPHDIVELAIPEANERLLVRRFFNRPTGIEPGDAIWIVCHEVAGEFQLNNRPFDPQAPLPHPLPARNELLIRLTTSLSPEAEIALEIRAQGE